VIDKCDNKKQSELTTCTADKSPVLTSNCQLHQLFIVMTENGLKTGVYQLMKELSGRWEMIGARCWLFGKDTNSSEHNCQNYATSGWILAIFAAVVQRDRRTVPPSMEGQGALGAMMGACPIPDVDGRDG
jgi:hypothetical protein